MSERDVEFVRALQPAPEDDLVDQFRSEEWWAATTEALAEVFEPELVCEIVWPGRRERYLGADGLRAGWLDWLSVWDSYHVEVDDVIDLGDRVLVLTRDRGRRADTTAELYVLGGSIWTIRDGKVAQVEFYADRGDAFDASRLADDARPQPEHR